MGQCYSISLRYKARNEAAALKALLDKIDRDEHAPRPDGAHYHLEEMLDRFSMSRDSLQDVLRVVFVERGWSRISVSDTGWTIINNDFDCCYGWHWVMLDAFACIAPYLEDDSSLEIWPDDGQTTNVVRDGVSVSI